MKHPLLVCLLVATAHADRADWIARELAAVRELGPARRVDLERDVYEAARVRCHTDTSARCFADVADGVCHGDATCAAAADVVAANTRAANDWVDEATRAQLVRGSADYRIALAAELNRRFGALASELALAGGRADAAAIDELCRTRDRAVHACTGDDATCVPSLPWSRCVSALVWYTGSQR
ncbi:MAG TPA: hypothetical protein VMJ10_29190 [Kofleriaceae bacterium]|nr:hypothetical protein [Kofleriaceae bacterium]